MPYRDNIKRKAYQKNYMSEYRKANKEKINKQRKVYYLTHQDKEKYNVKIWRQNNPEKLKEIQKQRYLKHRDKLIVKRKEYAVKKADKIKEYRKNNRSVFRNWKFSRREEWYTYFKQIGKDKCSICGYNKFWGAIDFHHINPHEKEKNIGSLTILRITEERKKEVKKCIALCSNCHRELHYFNNCQTGSHLMCEHEGTI